ncbi:MAG: EpsG family protein [bacterium]
MVIYFVVLAVAVAAIHLADRPRLYRLERLLFLAVAFLALVLVAGLRSDSVGTDADAYTMAYRMTQTLADVVGGQFEAGFLFLCWLGRQVTDDYIALFTLVGIIVSVCFLWGIRRYSVNPALSVFVLLASGAVYYSFNGLRQGLAIALFFVSIGAIYHRKLLLFLACVAVAYLFHTSAIVILPVYFLVPRKNSLRYNVLVFGGVLVATLFFSELASLAGRLNPRYVAYTVPTEGSRGLLFAAFVVSMGTFFLYFKRHVLAHRPLYDFLLNIYLLGLVVTLVAVVMGTGASGIMRLGSYFSVSQVLIWPIVFANLRRHRERAILLAAFTVGYLVYHATTLRAFSQLVPYRFNPSVLAWFSSIF